MLASGALAPADQFINKHQNSEIKTCSENWLDICTFGQGRTYAHFWPDIRTFYGRTYAHFIAGHMHISWPDICTYSTAKAVPPAGQGGQKLKIGLRHNLQRTLLGRDRDFLIREGQRTLLGKDIDFY